ncbi:MAG: hypothetical protein ACREBG_27280 [Pyrinomonadaceae bacterium]
MKPFRRLVAVSILALAVSAIAFAGDVQTPGVTTPPPPPPPPESSSSKITVAVVQLVIRLIS